MDQAKKRKLIRRVLRRRPYLRVTSAGRLEVDGQRLFEDEKVQADVRALRAIPLSNR